MNDIIGTHDPEQIDQDVTIYYRNLTKLERTFINTSAPLALAQTVFKTLKSFWVVLDIKCIQYKMYIYIGSTVN